MKIRLRYTKTERIKRALKSGRHMTPSEIRKEFDIKNPKSSINELNKRDDKIDSYRKDGQFYYFWNDTKINSKNFNMAKYQHIAYRSWV